MDGSSSGSQVAGSEDGAGAEGTREGPRGGRAIERARVRPKEPSAGPGARPFTLVLAGGGARGYAHVGVLRSLERRGWRPSALVGVSMGAVVAAAYALNSDWSASLLASEVGWLHGPPRPAADGGRASFSRRARRMWDYGRATLGMLSGWGTVADGDPALRLLRSLTRGRDLADGRVPVAICATDLRTGERVTLREGDAAEAAYASSALAGVVPPLERGEALLADGAYTDLAPIDVARSFGHPLVLAVDPGQDRFVGDLGNGLQALVRAFEICHVQHARLRFAEADLVLRPDFRRAVDVLDFDARRECVAAGIRAVRARRETLEGLLVRPAPRS